MRRKLICSLLHANLLTAITVLAVTALAPGSYAQQSILPRFEVASIRRSDPKKPLPPAIKLPPGRFEATSITLKELIVTAYQLPFAPLQQISSGPAWINSEKFDIAAKEGETIAAQLEKLSPEQQGSRRRMMIQELLADRFKLSIHHETRELPAYTLLLAKGGPKLKPGVLDPTLPANRQSNLAIRGSGFLVGRNSTISLLAKVLSMQPEMGGRAVIDKTSLSGKYDFTLKWMPDSAIDARSPRAETHEDLPQLFTALQEQLGLRLAGAKAPVDVIIVDNAEMPSEN